MLLQSELQEEMGGFFNCLFPWRDELTDDIDLPDCLFLGAIPQQDARWSWPGEVVDVAAYHRIGCGPGAESWDGHQARVGAVLDEQPRYPGLESLAPFGHGEERVRDAKGRLSDDGGVPLVCLRISRK